MKKVINTSLAGIAFSLEESAYNALQTYLNSIETHFISNQDGAEIVADIESSIAEKLVVKLDTSQSAVTLEMIEDIVLEMGRVEDIIENTRDETGEPRRVESTHETGTPRQLFRNSDDVVISGVSSGIANYFNLDPIFVRLGFILFSLFSGVGVIAYLLLWLMVPSAKTVDEKHRMRGEKVTLSSIMEHIQEGVDHLKVQENSGIKSFWNHLRTMLDRIFQIVGRGFQFLLRFVRQVIGFVLTVGGVLSIIGFISGFVWLFFLTNASTVDPTTLTLISEIKGGAIGLILLISFFLTVLTPAILVVITGVGILKKQNYLSAHIMFSFGAGWVLASAIAVSTFLIIFPTLRAIVVYSSEMQSSQERIWHDVPLKGIPEDVLIRGNVQFRLVEDEQVSLRILASDRALQDIHISDKGGSLTVDRASRFRVCLFCSLYEPFIIELHTSNIKELEVGGSGDIILEGGYDDNFEMSIIGSFQVSVEGINLSNLNLAARGSHDITLLGTTKNAVFDISGASILYAEGLNTEIVSIDASGANNIYVNPHRILTGTLGGANNVYYIDNTDTHVDIERSPKGSNSVQTIKVK